MSKFERNPSLTFGEAPPKSTRFIGVNMKMQCRILSLCPVFGLFHSAKRIPLKTSRALGKQNWERVRGWACVEITGLVERLLKKDLRRSGTRQALALFVWCVTPCRVTRLRAILAAAWTRFFLGLAKAWPRWVCLTVFPKMNASRLAWDLETYEFVCKHIDGWMDEWMDGWTDRLKDRLMN